jgi:hypothetical protein
MNRKEFKSLLLEWNNNFISEMSRSNKKYFDSVKHPSLKGESDVLFIHWFRPFHKDVEDERYDEGDARRYMMLGSERLESFMQNTLNKKEVACNLLSPSSEGEEVDYQFTHNYSTGKNWGYLGVVIKGHPTYGTLDDNASVIDDTPSGERIRSYGWGEERETRDKEYIDYESIEKLNTEFEPHDLDSFNKKHDIPYAETEFHVKPTEVLGVVLYKETEDALNSVLDNKLEDAEESEVFEGIEEAFGDDPDDQIEAISLQELTYIKTYCMQNNLKLLEDPSLIELNDLRIQKVEDTF